MNTTIETQTTEDEIDLGQIFNTLKRYKYSVIFVALLATFFAGAFAYFSPNIYSSSATIFVKSEKSGPSGGDDFMNMALGMQSNNIDNEIEILKSYTIASMALKNLDIGTRYFKKHKLKTVELYQSMPFIVNSRYLSKNALSSLFKIIPIDNDSFRLIIEASLKQKTINYIRSKISTIPADEKPMEYNKIHKYGEEINTPWFALKVQKIY